MKIKTDLLSACLILSSPVFASPEGREIESISLDSLSAENQIIEYESENSKSTANQGLEDAEEVEKSDNEESKAFLQQAKDYCKENPRKCIFYATGAIFATAMGMKIYNSIYNSNSLNVANVPAETERKAYQKEKGTRIINEIKPLSTARIALLDELIKKRQPFNDLNQNMRSKIDFYIDDPVGFHLKAYAESAKSRSIDSAKTAVDALTNIWKVDMPQSGAAEDLIALINKNMDKTPSETLTQVIKINPGAFTGITGYMATSIRVSAKTILSKRSSLRYRFFKMIF